VTEILHIAATAKKLDSIGINLNNWRITTVCGENIPAFLDLDRVIWSGVVEEYLEGYLEGRTLCEDCANHPLRDIYALNWVEL